VGEARGSGRVIERKLKPDGSLREYPCELVHLGKDFAVISYVVEDPASFATPLSIERGTVSHGWFWKAKPYGVYRMHTPSGELLHRFDALDRLEITAHVISYRDLILDWWVLPGGRLIEEDRAELEALVSAGTVDGAFQAKALASARAVTSRYRHIIDELGRLERRLKVGPAQ
jgi:hypothetical protein